MHNDVDVLNATELYINMVKCMLSICTIKERSINIKEKNCVVSSSIGMNRVGTIGQVWEVTRAESPGCLATSKTRKLRTLPPG